MLGLSVIPLSHSQVPEETTELLMKAVNRILKNLLLIKCVLIIYRNL